MDVSSIVQIIGSLGFPIAACIAVFWYLMKESENHKAEVTKLTEALQNNTLALTKLSDELQNKTLALTKLCDELEKER